MSPQSHFLGLALLLNRLALGFYFFAAGYQKIFGYGVSKFLEGYRATTPSFVPDWFATPYGYALPFAEIILGVTLMLGLLGRLSAFLILLVLTSITIALWVKYGPGGAEKPPVPWMHSNVILATLALLLTVLGPGPISIDALLRRKPNTKPQTA